MDIQLAGTMYHDLESLSKHVETHHLTTLFSIFKEHCGTYVQTGILRTHTLVDSVDKVIDAGHQTSYGELQSRMRNGDNYLGTLFLTGLETLWRKKEEELQKLNANIVNPRPAVVC